MAKKKYGHPLRSTWYAMIRRCHHTNDARYKDYGARGVVVCDRWRNSFDSFASDKRLIWRLTPIPKTPAQPATAAKCNECGTVGYHDELCSHTAKSDAGSCPSCGSYDTFIMCGACKVESIGGDGGYAMFRAAVAAPPSPAARETKPACQRCSSLSTTMFCGNCIQGITTPGDAVISSNRNPVANRQQYRVWECKIVVPANAAFPAGFDYPPRRAAIDTVERHGVPVITCFSGWGGTLTELEARSVDEDAAREGK